MKILTVALCTISMLAASATAFAGDDIKSDAMHEKCMSMQMKKMDTNGDGMISKDEYMAANAKHWT